MGRKVLVAGVGNIFFGDDAFGVEVARRLQSESLPEGVKVEDFGIRGTHLAYELLDGAYDTTVLVDATPQGGKPGTVYLIQPDLDAIGGDVVPDAHTMSPEGVFATLKALGGTPGRVLIVGCEPENTGEGAMGLSRPVEGAVNEAVDMIRRLVAEG